MSPEKINKTMTVPEVIGLFGGNARQLVLLSGIPASGKSTFGLSLAKAGYDYHNADAIRAELYGDESILGDTKTVFGILHERLRTSLAAGRKAVVDVTNLTARNRQEFIDAGAEFNYPPCIIVVMDISVSLSLSRNKARTRHVPEHVIMSMVTAVVRSGLPSKKEGRALYLRPTDKVGQYKVLSANDLAVEQIPSGVHAADLPVSQLIRVALKPGEKEKFDIVGDVHSCFNELVSLITKLGHTLKYQLSKRNGVKVLEYKAKGERKLAFVGDLVDRGPHAARVLALVRWLVNNNHAIVVSGNHDDRLLRFLEGKRVRVHGSLKGTVDQLKHRKKEFRLKVRSFLSSLPLIHESASLVVVHAAYREGKVGQEMKNLALFGETCDSHRNERGRHIRLTLWEDQYNGKKTIVRGHDVVKQPRLKLTANGGWIVNIDTGCCFGNALTAFRYPEMYFVSVPAERVHYKPDTPIT